jgi:hypothetical protein
MNSHKIVIKIKKEKLYDEYVLTNKHIICQFKYLVVCFESNNESEPSAGLICLSNERLQQLINEQNILLDSTKEDSYLYPVLNNLKEWHPKISKVEIDTQQIYDIRDLSEYQAKWSQYSSYFEEYRNNNCISNESDFEVFKNIRHNIVNVKVYFQLIKKITHVNEYGINFRYLRQLLTEQLLARNNESPIFLDEVSIQESGLPFAKKLNYVLEEDIYYVYPYMGFIPLISKHKDV